MEITLSSDLAENLVDAAVGDKVSIEATVTKIAGGIVLSIDSAEPTAAEETGEEPQGGDMGPEMMGGGGIPGPVRTLLKRGK